MDNKKAVIVLAPNGRRQTVKVDPNTTILQIIEEVCKKQGFKSEEYDIKHHNKRLDTSTIIRFSGLPNNAQLELADAVQIRSEGIVTLGIQLENGTRLLDSFTPNSSLWDVLIKLCPEEANPDTNPVVVYMRKEIYGQTTLQDTTLRSLGLTNGRAMLRLLHRSPEVLQVQANVSVPLPSRPTEEKPYIRKFQKINSSPPPSKNIKPSLDTESVQYSEIPTKETTSHENSFSNNNQDNNLTKFIKQEKRKHENTIIINETKGIPESSLIEKENTVAEEDFIFVGERNAMIFSQETAVAIPTEELPDDFFELTITDAKKLLKDIKKRRLELENAPLQTSGLRNLQESTRQLMQLNRYKQTVIRIYFQDQSVLQGTFKPMDTVAVVMEFVKEYLENKNVDFYLYTAPPKNVLNIDSRLMEIGCVPNGILRFGINSTIKAENFLRKDLLNKFTTQSIASLAAAKMRQEGTRVLSTTVDDDDMDSSNSQNDVNQGASTSKAMPHYEDYQRQVSPPKDTKVPKWFKPLK